MQRWPKAAASFWDQMHIPVVDYANISMDRRRLTLVFDVFVLAVDSEWHGCPTSSFFNLLCLSWRNLTVSAFFERSNARYHTFHDSFLLWILADGKATQLCFQQVPLCALIELQDHFQISSSIDLTSFPPLMITSSCLLKFWCPWWALLELIRAWWQRFCLSFDRGGGAKA